LKKFNEKKCFPKNKKIISEIEKRKNCIGKLDLKKTFTPYDTIS
jgi:hypothetical protein